MLILSIIALVIMTIVFIGVNIFVIVDACKRRKNSAEWVKFLDDAGVKLD